jgi:uroporphyrin-3 C-methyltransferase
MSENEEKPTDSARADADWTELASRLSADKPSRPTTRPPAAGGEQRSSIGSFASAFALVLALIAIGVAGMLWWQYRAFYVSLNQTDASTAQSLERVRAEQRSLQDGLKDVTEDVDTLRERGASVSDRLDALPSRFVDLEQRLDAVQGGSFDARGALLRSEAEYYLTVANTELTFARNWDNAIKALELADGRLAEIGNPELAPVRDAIAGELLALKSVRLPDIEGLLFSLGRLAARVDELPMRADPSEGHSAERAAAVSSAEPGLARLWISIKQMLLGLVRIERRDSPVPQALSAAERALGRRELEIELEVARTSALRAQAQAFQSALDRSLAVLERDFDTDSGDVDGARALLREMRNLDVDPKRPDISGSLNQLRQIAAGAR